MQVLSDHVGRAGAEHLVRRLLNQLRCHAVLDALLLCAPPALFGLFTVALLVHARWLAMLAAIIMGTMIVFSAAGAVFFRLRPARPSVRSAARLADQRSGAQDHFLTLATIDAAREAVPFVARLRQQSESFSRRIDVRRDFPYRFKRSALWSWTVSLLAALVVYFLLPAGPGAASAPLARQRMAELIERMAAQPPLQELARRLKELAVKLDEPKTPPAEKQAAIREMKQNIEEQRAKEQQSEQQALLGQTAEALEGLEKEQQTAGGQDWNERQKGGGGIQTNANARGEGESRQDPNGGEAQGESTPQSSEQKIDRGKSAQANPKEQGESMSNAGDAKGDQKRPDPNQASQEPTKQKAEKGSGDSKDGAGKQQASEEPPPQGGPQADRFYKPGEGKEGLSGKKEYVTVQLPEEVVADSKGHSAVSKNPSGGRARTKVPVSNVPLPPHVPNAPTEKQHVPLEYRGILR